MLVLSRKQGESIRLPLEEVTITVLRLSHGRVRLGITAPAEVLVIREEVREAVADDIAHLKALIPSQA